MSKNIILIDNRPGELGQVGEEAATMFKQNPWAEGIMFKERGLSHYIPRNGIIDNRGEAIERIPEANVDVD